MSVFFRPRRAAARATPGSVQTEARSGWWPSAWSSASFPPADLSSAEASLQKVAVWSAVDLICSLASELPLDVFRGTGGDRQTQRTPGHLMDPAGDGNGLADWITQVLWSWLLRGNAFGVVHDRNPRGDAYPTAVELLHPDRVSVFDSQDPRRGVRGVVYQTERGELPAEQVFHRRVYPVPGEVLGLSPIRHHAATVGLGIAITNFGRQWFEDGAHPSGMLTNTETELNAEQAATAKDRFLAALRGSREPVVLGKGWSYERIQIAPEESQFLESNQFTSAECARMFGPGIAEILGYESGGSMTYSNVESRSTHLLVYALNRWILRVERVLTSMLPRGQYAKLNRDALLQTTTLERFRAHEIALRNRIRVVNEVRDIEDLPPTPWGDEPNPIAGAPADPVLDPAGPSSDQSEDENDGNLA